MCCVWCGVVCGVRERAVELALVRAASRAGGIAYKFSSPARRGVPDRIVVLPGGILFFVECKASGGRLTRLQALEGRRLERLGFEFFVVDSVERAREIVDEKSG